MIRGRLTAPVTGSAFDTSAASTWGAGVTATGWVTGVLTTVVASTWTVVVTATTVVVVAASVVVVVVGTTQSSGLFTVAWSEWVTPSDQWAFTERVADADWELCAEVPVANPLPGTGLGLSEMDAPFTAAESNVMVVSVSLLPTVQWTVQEPSSRQVVSPVMLAWWADATPAHKPTEAKTAAMAAAMKTEIRFSAIL
jgi:hypothetical protein